MVDAAQSDVPEVKSTKIPFIAAIAMLLAGIIFGLYIAYSGILAAVTAPSPPQNDAKAETTDELAFVALDPIVVSIVDDQNRYLLKFVGSLDVNPAAIAEIELLKPRIADILNGYLRALTLEDIEQPAALIKIRSHLLHRVRVVAGEQNINDLLIVEFVMN